MMDDLIPKILAAIIAAIIIGAAKTYFFTRRLYLIQPKLFDYSDLANAKNAKTVELTIFNGGAKSEEKIAVQLSPMFIYTVVASNRSGLSVNNGVLEIERIAPKEDVTIVLAAEGGEFRKEHVIGVTSKEAKGTIKASIQEAQVSQMQAVFFALLILVVFPFGGYLVGKVVESEFGEPSWFKEEGESSWVSLIFETKNKKIDYGLTAEKEEKKLSETYKVLSASRRGEYVALDIALQNNTSNRIEVTIFSSSPVSEQREGHWAEINPTISDVMVFPGVGKKVRIVDYLPTETDPSLISLRFVIESSNHRVDINEDVNFVGEAP